MDITVLEIEAREAALRNVKNMLQRTGQLEKVELYRNRTRRKKTSAESMLKNAMQNQLDGVRVGLKRLKSSIESIDDINLKLDDTGDLLSIVIKIFESLEHVRDEYARHSQYATAIENLKHIFTIQTSVTKTMQWIEEDKLLHAHQCLSDLENSRDDLLFELHKMPKQSAHDKITLKRYFEKVDTVSLALERKIRLILNRTLNTVRKEPTVIVTALRIIEREEKSDQFAINQQKQTGFMPPNRPKQWHKMQMEVLNQGVVQRIESSKLDERSDNKLWLVRNLEIARQFILEDLRVVKSLCVPCFKPSSNIFFEYVKMYHSALSKSLEEIVEQGLEGNEYVTVLSWVLNTYPGAEMMSHPDLKVDLSTLGPLLKLEYLDQMKNEYLKTMERNYEDWMTKTLETEKQSWQNGSLPEEEDNEKYFHTSAPVIVFQMIDQNLQVTNTIHPEITFSALVLSVQQVTLYGQNYLRGIIEFKDSHFRDRSQAPFFTQHMITIVNNCQQMVELAHQMKQLYWPKSRTDNYAEFEKLITTFQNLRNDAATYLLNEAFLDLDVHFKEVFTQQWIGSNIAVDTICVTLADYFNDYSHLRVINFEFVLSEAQKMVVKRYLQAMLSKKLNKPKAECDQLAKKACKEAQQLQNLFDKVNRNVSGKTDSPIQIISALANLLTADLELLVLDLHTLLANYPSITEDHLVRLFHVRNDIKVAEAREKIQDAINSKKSKKGQDPHASIFQHLAFPDKLW